MNGLANKYHYIGPLTARQYPAMRSNPSWKYNFQVIFASGNTLAARGSMDISDWRNKIDELDEQIVQLLSKRATAAAAIGELKAQRNAAVYEPQREQAVFEHVRRVNPGPLSGAQVQDVYERLVDVMRALQRTQE